jgi:hypothetical protein
VEPVGDCVWGGVGAAGAEDGGVAVRGYDCVESSSGLREGLKKSWKATPAAEQAAEKLFALVCRAG